MAHSLVAIDERMILNEEKAKGRSSLYEGGIKVVADDSSAPRSRRPADPPD
jgi:hypothetical protein